MAVEQRYDYIDTLKGGAMIFVVLYHSCFLNTFYTSSVTFVPLFFMVSGFLFKADVSWKDLLFRNMRMLLLPYLVYNVLHVIFCNSLHAIGVNMSLKSFEYIFYTTHADRIPNVTTWYLLVLFFVTLLFKSVWSLSATFKPVVRYSFILVILFLSGYVGYRLALANIFLPYLFDIVAIALLFFGLGYLFSLCITKAPSQYDRWGYLLIIPLIVVYILSRGYISMAACEYNLPYWRLLIMTIALFLSQFYLCKYVGYVPFVTYMGRYSLIVLCTNMMVIPIMMGISLRFFDYDQAVVAASIATLVVSRWVVIPFCIRYMPYVSGIKR